MLVIAVRSFGIIGGGAFLFGASAIVGQTILGILPAIGEVQQFVFGIILKVDFLRIGNSRSSTGNSVNVLSSLLHRTDRTMLPTWSRTEGKACLSKIVLVVVFL